MNIDALLDRDITNLLDKLPRNRESAFIIRNGELLCSKNYSKNPNNVLINSDSVLDDDIVGHTHYTDSQAGRFSFKDIITAKRRGCKILLYHTQTKEFDYFDPDFPHPYPLELNKKNPTIKDFLGLRYEPIRCDCYSYTRDVALAIYGLKLPNLFKTNIRYETLKRSFLNPEEIGFKKTYEIKAGNFVLMNFSKSIPFHMGILIGDGAILHALSETHPTGLLHIEYYKKNILGVYEFIN
jgi:hypothetical protein